uniref:NADH-ubiquinone oxidoreductase chain 3 n=1 Tax=Bemisia afer TaxID=166114 RepID=A0A0U2GVQ0_BEMAF|nr:NADH dehydrogenase subunit 3 [Bemisia afer]
MCIYLFLSLTIMLILIVSYFMLNTKVNHNREKYSTFECGMDLMTSLRLPFSLHFYFISIVFLVFDIELMLVLPFIYCLKLFNIMNILMMILVLITIIILGFMYEWWTGLLNWMI